MSLGVARCSVYPLAVLTPLGRSSLSRNGFHGSIPPVGSAVSKLYVAADRLDRS